MTAIVQDDYGSPGMKHRRVVVTRHGGPDVLQVVEEDLPEPQAGEVRVKVLAAGISGYDLMDRRYSFPGGPPLPYTPGQDIVGVVDRLGEGVSAVEPGQEVAGFTFGDAGGYTEYICRPANELVPVPAGLDPAEAVCVVVNYLTAHMVLHGTAKARSGERVLVHGAAGGTGSALLELGRLAGLEMYGTASKYNHEVVSALGATPIDYRTEDFVERIRSLTGDGVDAVLDPIGGARHIWRSYRALRKGGRYVGYGMVATSKAGMRAIPFSLLMLVLLQLIPGGRKASMSAEIATFSEAHDGWYRETLTELLDWLVAGRIQPVVAERIPLVEAARAHARLERGGYAGKVVLVAGA
ncbi:MAG: medium chain dehydrogenase/reductase family protein [Anaerolineae bacterium]|jgi:NADPH:quinone reductase-like Zn-dependent oxidoreductase